MSAVAPEPEALNGLVFPDITPELPIPETLLTYCTWLRVDALGFSVPKP